MEEEVRNIIFTANNSTGGAELFLAKAFANWRFLIYWITAGEAKKKVFCSALDREILSAQTGGAGL